VLAGPSDVPETMWRLPLAEQTATMPAALTGQQMAGMAAALIGQQVQTAAPLEHPEQPLNTRHRVSELKPPSGAADRRSEWL
jgi:hypothetical protein